MQIANVDDSLSRDTLVALPLVILSSLLTSFTPPHFPMILMTAAIVGGQAANALVSRAW